MSIFRTQRPRFRRKLWANPIDFKNTNALALPCIENILRQVLPNGKRLGSEWVALNPRRDDSRIGSFKINTQTGKWADFATGDKGGDIVSMVAYIKGCTQGQAARFILEILGIGC